MNDAHRITKANILSTFPLALQNDDNLMGIAEAISAMLALRPEEIKQLAIYPRIDELPESLLDVLAVDFKVDWYDPDYSLEQKRKIIKDNWRVHRTLGTKAAVETAIAPIYPDTKVIEWFEYGGDPYHFQMLIDSTFEGVDPERHRRVIERVGYYKNLRSVLDGIQYIVSAQGQAHVYAGIAATGTYTKMRVVVHAYGMQPEHIITHQQVSPVYAGVSASRIHSTIHTEVQGA